MYLFFLNLKTTFFRLYECLRVGWRYYHKISFMISDILLASHYILKNPHQVSKAFMKKRGEREIYVYGETPLTTLDLIMRNCSVLSKDVVFELGCGSGRTIFWLRHFIRCKAIGIDYQPTFIKRANRIKEWLHLDKTHFLLEDFLNADLRKATVIYLYGTCLNEATIKHLVAKFEQLRPETKIITVSYPLTEYSNRFRIVKKFPARFPWGKAEVFFNQQL